MALKAQKNPMVKTIKRRSKTPECPTHNKPLTYRAEYMKWVCPHRGCTKTLTPRFDESSGQPIVGKGDVELLMIKEPSGVQHVYLRSTENNVMVSLDDVLRSFDIQEHPGQTMVTVRAGLVLNKMDINMGG